MATVVTYQGREGDNSDFGVDRWPVPFEVGKPQVFGADQYAQLGFSSADEGDKWAVEYFGGFNANRPDKLALFKVTKKAPATTSTTDQGSSIAPAGEVTTQSPKASVKQPSRSRKA